MARTQIRGTQVLDRSVGASDINTDTPGSALITKIEAGPGVSLISTGVDSGTGVVTISIPVYHHIQSTPSYVWVIPHGLNKYPKSTVVLDNGDEVEGDINFADANNLTITFSQEISGNCYLS